MAREVEERFRPHLEVRVAEQCLGLCQDRAIAGLVQDREGPTAHLRVAVAEETAHRGVGGRRLTAHRHEVEGVEDLPRFHRPEAGGQHLRGLPVEDHRRGALGIEPVLPQTLAQRGHVAPVHPGRQQEPQADERQDHEHEADRAYPPERREQEHGEAGEAVPGPPCHRVDERFRGQLQAGGHRRIGDSTAGRSIE